jgi:hypothetical protein
MAPHPRTSRRSGENPERGVPLELIEVAELRYLQHLGPTLAQRVLQGNYPTPSMMSMQRYTGNEAKWRQRSGSTRPIHGCLGIERLGADGDTDDVSARE